MGFTLVELMVVIVVIASLAAVGLFGVKAWQDKAIEANMASDAVNVGKALRFIDSEDGVSGNVFAATTDSAGAVAAVVGTGLYVESLSEGITLSGVTTAGGFTLTHSGGITDTYDINGRP